MTKIKFKLSPKPSKTEKERQGKTGFMPVKARWVISVISYQLSVISYQLSVISTSPLKSEA
ncbi:MAG: hypothetical protein F6K17_21185 [Okeania sp. SIO3C4]|nr:hypothetical protein [Okeania sp. SIO3B3]NER04933.1 hypothetical protein [Okeania sp. SIO3C4]